MVLSNLSLFMLVVCTLNTSQKVLGVEKLEMEYIRGCENRCALEPFVNGKKITCEALMNKDEKTRKELCNANATTERYGKELLHRYYPKTCRPACRIDGQCEDYMKLRAELKNKRVVSCEDLKVESGAKVNALCETDARVLNKGGAIYKLKRVCRKTCRARECQRKPRTTEILGTEHIIACENKCALKPIVNGKRITCEALMNKDEKTRKELCNANATTDRYGNHPLHKYYPKTCRAKCRLEGGCKDYMNLKATLASGRTVSCEDVRAQSKKQMDSTCDTLATIEGKGGAKYDIRRLCPRTCRSLDCDPGETPHLSHSSDE
uniref:Uncharacterized protein n=1 Tax=Corethron hystrix TaxID=216773 RepID=A0A7S1C1M4_9STRA|mmetsp:Transcript_8769/g.19288  ORF Transcript_8769/g.19288 Transcript_8769/m.19288 type:complete len:321 (+) Transcript_8769:208-1170(+)